MTRREARHAREAHEAHEVPAVRPPDDEEVDTRPVSDASAWSQLSDPAAAQPGPPAQDEAHDASPHTPGPWTPPPMESTADRKALAGLDFDAVITGPIASVAGHEHSRHSETADRQPVGVTARHGTGQPAVHPHLSVHGVFPDPADEAEDGAGASPIVSLQREHSPAISSKRQRRWLRPLIVVGVILAVLGGLAGGAYAFFQPEVANIISAWSPSDNDYDGNGTGEVMFTIESGDTGDTIATNLHEAGVTKSYDAFYDLLLRQKPEVEFQPGVFALAKQMSAQAALRVLKDPSSRVQNTAVIPEGTAEKDALQIVADSTGIPLAELQQAAANPSEYGLPEQATTLEGFLFPATYDFPPGTTAHDAITTMVDRMFQALDQAGVPADKRWDTVVLASVVQREAGLKDDYPKVARVFLNRLEQGWDLQSDATVAYGTGNTHRVETTDAERADAGNLYNTYVHPGLPVGPISNPGDLAIGAVVHPTDGPWMFFVTWNLETGETIFSTTEAEHQAAVEKWQQWMKEHPGYE